MTGFFMLMSIVSLHLLKQTAHTMSKHQNSRIVTIFRLPNMIEKVQGGNQEQFFSASKMGVGSYFANGNTREVGSGLNNKEKNILLPLIINIPSDDREFRTRVEEFYVDISTNVPYNTGRPLEIGMEVNNAKDIEAPGPGKDGNLPINIMDYIRYRHALGHPWVAPSKDEGAGNQTKLFYVFDPEVTNVKNTNKSKERDAALAIYLKVKESPESVDQILTMLNINVLEYNGMRDKDEAKIAKLHDLIVGYTKDNKPVEGIPARIVEVYNEDQMSVKYWIKRMVNAKALVLSGSKYFDGQNKEVVANSLDEMIAYFLDEGNSGVVGIYKARTQEAELLPVQIPIRKTVV